MFYRIINSKMQKKFGNIRKIIYKAQEYSVLISLCSRAERDFLALNRLLHRYESDRSERYAVRLASPAGEYSAETHRHLARFFSENRNTLVSMGWAGAQTYLLTRQEAEWEFTWAISNPWNTGAEQLWGVIPRVLYPVAAYPQDLKLVPDTFELAIAGSFVPGGSYHYLSKRHRSHVDAIELFDPPRPPVLPAGSSNGGLLVHLRLAPGFEPERAVTTLQTLRARFDKSGAGGTDLQSLLHERNGIPEPTVEMVADAGQIPPAIDLARIVSSVSGSRRSLGNLRERNRSVLTGLGRTGPHIVPLREPDTPARVSPERRRDTITSLGSMAGQALLQEGPLKVRALAGRLAEIRWKDSVLLPLQRAQGSLRREDGKTVYREMKAANAYEDLHVHGVLEESELAGIRCHSRLFFAEHYQGVFYRVAADFPVYHPRTMAREFTLLRLKLGTLLVPEKPDRSAPTGGAWYPDGCHKTWTLPTEAGLYPIAGSTIRFPDDLGGLSVAWPDAIGPMTLEVVDTREGSDYFLHPFLHGRDIPMHPFSGFRFSATIVLGRDLAPEGALFSLPSAAKNHFLPYSFERTHPAGSISPE